jgi:anaphase-promoting complex subunit 6
LSDVYGLADCPLILQGKAESLMIHADFQRAFKILEQFINIKPRLVESHPYNFEILTNYIICASRLSKTNLLFSLSHKLVELFPKDGISWFSVGTFYLTESKFSEARTYYK